MTVPRTVQELAGAADEAMGTRPVDHEPVTVVQVEPSEGVEGHGLLRGVIHRRADPEDPAMEAEDVVSLPVLGVGGG